MGRLIWVLILALLTGCAGPRPVPPPPLNEIPVAGEAAGKVKPTGPVELVIGGVVSLTGSVASSGVGVKAGWELAASELNQEFAKAGEPWRVRLDIMDSGSDPDVAADRMQVLYGRGVRIVMGPDTSSQVEAMIGFANANGVLLVSHGSSAIDLAGADDNLLRFCPSDEGQAESIANLMAHDRVKAVVPFWPAGKYGDGLVALTRHELEGLGVRMLDGIRYQNDTRDYAGTVQRLNEILVNAAKEYGQAGIGVFYLGGDELFDFVSRSGRERPVFDIKWYGSDAADQAPTLVKYVTGGNFAVQTRFTTSVYGEPDSKEYERVSEAVRKATNGESDVFAATGYDALKTVVRALAKVDGDTSDMARLRQAVMDEAKASTGATGPLELDANGDRRYGSFDFNHVIVEGAGQYKWVRLGRCLRENGGCRVLMDQ